MQTLVGNAASASAIEGVREIAEVRGHVLGTLLCVTCQALCVTC